MQIEAAKNNVLLRLSGLTTRPKGRGALYKKGPASVRFLGLGEGRA